MFEKLTYSVTFPSTGRSFAGDIDFKTGFGTITGPNEAGKSLIIEIARWCLFGSAALRGKAEDYKTLKGDLTFSVRGEKYRVDRTQNSVKLIKIESIGCMVLATGTKPVNAHITSLLGFGLEVFDVACAANQGDVERLSTMKPTERKRMVDEVVGLNRLEDLAKWCGDEARALEKAQVDPGTEPVAPAQPMGHLEAARAAYEELHQLNGVLSVAVAPPVDPVCPGPETAGELKTLVDWEAEVRAERRVLQMRLQSLPEASDYSDAELDTLERINSDYTQWRMREQFEKLHPISFQTRGALLVMRDDWAVVGQRDSLRRLVAELEKHGEVDCPNCQHHFFLENNRLEDLELSPKVGDGGNREGGISWGCLTPPLLHRRSDMPCPKITSSS